MKALRIIFINILLLFQIPLREKHAAWIFKYAAETMYKNHYMCVAIADVIPYNSIEELEKFGFTRYMYHCFVKDSYPELEGLLIHEKCNDAWISISSKNREAVIESKYEFLIELSESCSKSSK